MVAMTVVRMVQVAIHEVIDMIAMRHGLVAAAGAVHVVGWMAAASVAGGARCRIRCIDGNHVLVDMVAVRVVQVAIVQVVDVAVVLYGGVPAAGAMDVGMFCVGGAGHVRGSSGSGDHASALRARTKSHRWDVIS